MSELENLIKHENFEIPKEYFEINQPRVLNPIQEEDKDLD
jgi:hypothetical protein